MRLVLLLEVAAVGLCPLDPVGQIVLEALLEMLVGQLLQQHGGQPHCHPRLGVEEHALINDGQQRQICLRRRLVQPILPMRPHTVIQHIRQVPVQHQTKAANRHR